MHLRTYVFVTALLLMLTGLPGCASGGNVDPLPGPPTRDQIVGTWLGFSLHCAYRLDLFADGTGALATAWLLEEGVVRRYETTRWELDEFDLSATFVPTDAERGPVCFRAVARLYDDLRDVSISGSDLMPVPTGVELTRESRVKEWQRLLTPPDIASDK